MERVVAKPKSWPAHPKPMMCRVARLLLIGVRDPESTLHILSHGDAKQMVRMIWEIVDDVFRKAVQTKKGSKKDFLQIITMHDANAKALDIWPKPTGININMMPFVFGKEKETIPKEYHGYLPLIRKIHEHSFAVGQIFYLTIHESEVEPDTTQRRPGLHCESPGKFGGGILDRKVSHSWGGGSYVTTTLVGGIFFGSNTEDSTAVYNCRIDDDSVIGHLGDVEALRSRIDNPKVEKRLLKLGQLVWMTDKTPHEALPVKKKCYRQFFRVVTEKVDVWYTQHNTENKLGVKPPLQVKIIDGDKFAKQNCE